MKIVRNSSKSMAFAFPPFSFLYPFFSGLLSLLEAARAAHLPVRVEQWRDGIWNHAFQDVILCGHHVLDQEICSFVDVKIVLKTRHFIYRQMKKNNASISVENMKQGLLPPTF